jgi:hypothetical protein
LASINRVSYVQSRYWQQSCKSLAIQSKRRVSACCGPKKLLDLDSIVCWQNDRSSLRETSISWKVTSCCSSPVTRVKKALRSTRAQEANTRIGKVGKRTERPKVNQKYSDADEKIHGPDSASENVSAVSGALALPHIVTLSAPPLPSGAPPCSF